MIKNSVSMKNSILRILNAKSEKELVILIYSENAKFVEELLEKKITTSPRSGTLYSLAVKMEKITEEDVTILQEYLEYLIMIEQ